MRPTFATDVDEIARDPALRLFGVACAGVNVVTACFWLISQPLGLILDPATVPTVCWPFFEDCYRWRFLSAAATDVAVCALLLLSVYNGILFLSPHRIATAHRLLMVLTAAKLIWILQDYRLVLNQHYMATWVSGVYLLAPSKRTSLRWLLVSFYWWAGTLKVNDDWLSGAALFGRHPLGLPDDLIPLACAYVVALELLVAPLLLARTPWLRNIALGQFGLFHLASWWVVGFFYPILMLLLLSIFPLTSRFPTEQALEGPRSAWTGLRGRWGAIMIVGVFAAMQLLPRFCGADPALSGEGRMFALNMFDAPIRCEATITIHDIDGEARVRPLRPEFLQRRIACDPLVYFQASRFLCRAGSHLLGHSNFDVSLRSGRQGQSMREVVSIRSFCTADYEYALFRRNSWIQLE